MRFAFSFSVFLLLVASLRAQSSKDLGEEPLVLTGCRLKLHDDVALAAARPGIIALVGLRNENGTRPLREGDVVSPDDILVFLQDDVAKARLASAQKKASSIVNIKFAEAAYKVAKVEHQSALDITKNNQNAISEIEVERLRLEEEKAALSIEQAREERELNLLLEKEAAVELETFKIKAPFGGVITKVYKHTGEAVNQGDPILELVNTRQMRVEGYVDVRDAWRVRDGQKVAVQIELPEVPNIEQKTYQGVVVFVDVAVEPVTRKVRVWAEVANRDGTLKSGLTASMSIQTQEVVR